MTETSFAARLLAPAIVCVWLTNLSAAPAAVAVKLPVWVAFAPPSTNVPDCTCTEPVFVNTMLLLIPPPAVPAPADFLSSPRLLNAGAPEAC